jgi:uncharacterized membrane protein YeaQ/YmgE (transglycosylase-associated protein family)
MELFTGIAIGYLIVGFIIYWLPSAIASRRDHNSFYLIFFLNIFLGWTGVIWLVLLIWAIVGDTKADKRLLMTVVSLHANANDDKINLRKQLLDIDSLKLEGILTQDEYDMKKQQILGV